MSQRLRKGTVRGWHRVRGWQRDGMEETGARNNTHTQHMDLARS